MSHDATQGIASNHFCNLLSKTWRGHHQPELRQLRQIANVMQGRLRLRFSNDLLEGPDGKACVSVCAGQDDVCMGAWSQHHRYGFASGEQAYSENSSYKEASHGFPGEMSYLMCVSLSLSLCLSVSLSLAIFPFLSPSCSPPLPPPLYISLSRSPGSDNRGKLPPHAMMKGLDTQARAFSQGARSACESCLADSPHSLVTKPWSFKAPEEALPCLGSLYLQG